MSRCGLPKLRADDFSCLGGPQRFFPASLSPGEDEDDEDDFYVNLNPQTDALESDRTRSWDRVLERALMTTPIDSRAFRAGVILNPLRGLTATEREDSVDAAAVAAAASPTRPTDGDAADFKGFRESMKMDDKKLYLVDSGLSFNLPFPLMLRPQRRINLYITFDFSSRKSDNTLPFRVRSFCRRSRLLNCLVRSKDI
jgi:phospholipase A2